ncbi:putative FBD domain-containing protein [Helianthus anomalus]
MKQLELKGFWYYGHIPRLLVSCPELKHLCIEKHEDSYWIEPKSVPTCMLTNLTTVEFSKCTGQKCDKEFLEYILGNVKVLKKVIITCENSRVEEDPSVAVCEVT